MRENTEIVTVAKCTACNSPIGEKEHTYYDGCCQSCAYVIAGLIYGEIIEYEVPKGLYEDWQAEEFEEKDDDI